MDRSHAPTDRDAWSRHVEDSLATWAKALMDAVTHWLEEYLIEEEECRPTTPETERWLGKIRTACYGTRSVATDTIATVHKALVNAYEPPLNRDDRLRVLEAVNGCSLFSVPAAVWERVLLEGLMAKQRWLDADGDEPDPALDDLIQRLRALPRHEIILSTQWAWLVWTTGISCYPLDVEPFLNA